MGLDDLLDKATSGVKEKASDAGIEKAGGAAEAKAGGHADQIEKGEQVADSKIGD